MPTSKIIRRMVANTPIEVGVFMVKVLLFSGHARTIHIHPALRVAPYPYKRCWIIEVCET